MGYKKDVTSGRGQDMDRTRFSPLAFDSAALPADKRFATFASAMVNFDVSRRNDSLFAATANVWRVGTLVLTEGRIDPVTYDRGIARIAADQVDHLYVNYHVAGGVDFDSGGGIRHAGTGSLLAIDMRQPCRMISGDRQMLSLAIPRHLLLPRLDPFDPHGLIADGGLVPLLGATLQAVCASLPATPAAQAAAIERLIVDLVAETLLAALRAAEAVSPRSEALLMRVRTYLDAHLGEALDVAAICRGVGVSRSSLYRVCGGGGVLRLLQQRRLRRMRALLEDPGETSPIALLAERTGFRDKSHFSRAFRQAYGIAPGAFRANGAAEESQPALSENEAARVFRRWVSELD